MKGEYLMAIIDYHSVKSLIFASLKPCSRILIPVLSCLCDDWDGSLSPEHSKHEVLALYSGLATSSVKVALHELHDKGIISIDAKRGRPASIQYIPQLKLSAKGSRSSAILHQKVADNRLPLFSKESPQNPVIPGQNQNGKILALNDSPKRFKKQTQTIVPADLVGHSLVKHWIAIKGGHFVTSVLVEMGKKNGEIQDHSAYFVSCCRNGWIPTTIKAARERKEKEKRKKRQEREREEKIHWQETCQTVQAEQNDPAVQSRISKVCDDFLADLGVDHHNPPE